MGEQDRGGATWGEAGRPENVCRCPWESTDDAESVGRTPDEPDEPAASSDAIPGLFLVTIPSKEKLGSIHTGLNCTDRDLIDAHVFNAGGYFATFFQLLFKN